MFVDVVIPFVKFNAMAVPFASSEVPIVEFLLFNICAVFAVREYVLLPMRAVEKVAFS